MSYAGYDMLEVRFIIEPELTQCYVFCQAIGDCPDGVQGWHHKTFPASVSVMDIVKVYPGECLLWGRKAPPLK